MNTRTRVISALALGSTLVLAACGSDNNTTAGAPSSAPSVADCPTGTLTAEGSSAQKNAIETAISGFQQACPDVTINYNPSGSGAGIKNLIAGQVNFAGSDSALKPAEAASAAATCGSDAWNLPMVTGPIAVAYKLDGVDTLVLDSNVTAQIFSGAITTWNDPAIAALNPGVTLPDLAITVFFRSDESGTTENVTRYLHTAAPASWPAEPAKKWSGSVGEGKEKSSGVASAVQGTEGGITYVEWSYATQNQLGIAQIDNGSGAVELTAESAGKTVSTATVVGQGHDLALAIDYATKEPGAYPLVLVTYEIVCSSYADAETAAGVRSFLGYLASDEVQSGLEADGYAPLPAEVAAKVTTSIEAIR